VVDRHLDCGNPRCGFARIRCPDCGEERLLAFSCRTLGFFPSCQAKRLEEWGEWIRETLRLDVPHRQVVFTIPGMLRLFFKFNRRLLGEICRCALWWPWSGPHDHRVSSWDVPGSSLSVWPYR